MALATVLVLGAGGLFLSTAAHAEDAPVAVPLEGQAYDDLAQLLLQDPAIQAVGQDGNGQIVALRYDAVTPSVAGRSAIPEQSAVDASAIAAQFGNGITFKDLDAPIESTAAHEVLGGAGYAATDGVNVGLCSVGFSAWNSSGDPALVTAGHCTGDGLFTDAVLTQPAGDDAHVPGASIGDAAQPSDILGTIGFSQFGGVGNTPGAANSASSTDVAVIDNVNPALELSPSVTGWGSAAAAANDLSQSVATTITSVGVGKVGDPVSRSGRTTGLKSSRITWEKMWFKVIDPDFPTDESKARNVYGFGSEGLIADSGDSGGAAFSGTKAIGLVSASKVGQGPDDITLVADLGTALANTSGYTLQLAVDAPALTSPAAGGDVPLGSAITGTGPASTTLLVTPAGGAAFEVAIGVDGKWSIPTTTLGAYDFTVQAKNGQFNFSAVNSYSVNVVLGAPVITSPANGTTPFDSVKSIGGTGAPGAVVTMAGDASGTATVDSSGNWSIPVDLSYGDYAVSVSQVFGGESSAVVTSAFEVVPTVAVVTSPANGSKIALADVPEYIEGIGAPEAMLHMYITGGRFDEPTASGHASLEFDTFDQNHSDGTWVYRMPSLTPGDYTIHVTQYVTSEIKTTSASTFSVTGVVVPPKDQTPGDNNGRLATTGEADAPLGVAVLLMLTVGAGAVAFSRRRSAGASL
ncbi:S1 family peptidase [Lysinibacter cavernae]|uniref:Peptidase S1 domain-containing protein n=1 Tax=Lysinibacter cavernae TaxID=1640652 RepID=A0A7X5R3K8_9MICO|nr:S1 family peptidase [Lysinibacter cavernae]NIH54897.1 hypothetical protein [Lysinibacter cavernae]